MSKLGRLVGRELIRVSEEYGGDFGAASRDLKTSLPDPQEGSKTKSRFILLEYEGMEFKYGLGGMWFTQDQLARFFGVSRPRISGILRYAERHEGIEVIQLGMPIQEKGHFWKRYNIKHYDVLAFMLLGARLRKCGAYQRMWNFMEWATGNPFENEVGIVFLAQKEVKRGTKANVHSNYLLMADWFRCLDYWNNTCAYCGAQQSFWWRLEQDHIIPRSKGGLDELVNIVPACKSCNCSKHDNDLDVWLAKKFKPSQVKKIRADIEAYQKGIDSDR
jgi:hypothetical protein